MGINARKRKARASKPSKAEVPAIAPSKFPVRVAPTFPIIWSSDAFREWIGSMIANDPYISRTAMKSEAHHYKVRAAMLETILLSNPPAGNA